MSTFSMHRKREAHCDGNGFGDSLVVIGVAGLFGFSRQTDCHLSSSDSFELKPEDQD